MRSLNPQYYRERQFSKTILFLIVTFFLCCGGFTHKKYIGKGHSTSSMSAEEVSLGARVRYPKTGTTGKILHIEQIRGETFAELDSTHLLYRIDQLTPVTGAEKNVSAVVEDAKKVIAQEREFAAGSELQEALKNIDQSCEGGG
jgi:hypothetical protein